MTALNSIYHSSAAAHNLDHSTAIVASGHFALRWHKKNKTLLKQNISPNITRLKNKILFQSPFTLVLISRPPPYSNDSLCQTVPPTSFRTDLRCWQVELNLIYQHGFICSTLNCVYYLLLWHELSPAVCAWIGDHEHLRCALRSSCRPQLIVGSSSTCLWIHRLPPECLTVTLRWSFKWEIKHEIPTFFIY